MFQPENLRKTPNSDDATPNVYEYTTSVDTLDKVSAPYYFAGSDIRPGDVIAVTSIDGEMTFTADGVTAMASTVSISRIVAANPTAIVSSLSAAVTLAESGNMEVGGTVAIVGDSEIAFYKLKNAGSAGARPAEDENNIHVSEGLYLHLLSTYTNLVDTVNGLISTNQSSTTKFINRILTNNGDANCFVCSDSTGNDAWEWARLLCDYYAETYPTHTVNYYAWDDDNDVYLSPVVVSTGTGSNSINMYNAAVPGSKPVHILGEKFENAVKTIPTCDLVFINHGHNLGLGKSDEFTGYVRTPTLLAAAGQILTAHDGAGLVFIAQNPNRLDDTMGLMVNAVYECAGLLNADVADAYTRYINAGKPVDWYLPSDPIHPSELGQLQILEAVKSVHVKALPKIAISPFSNFAGNIVTNANFTELTGTLPDGWVNQQATLTQDNTNTESGKGYSINVAHNGATGRLKFLFTSGQINALKGKWITASCLVRKPSGASQYAGRMTIEATGLSTAELASYATDEGVGGFHRECLSFFVNDSVTSLEVRLYAGTSYASGASDNASYDRCTISVGKLPCDVVYI